MIKKEIFLNLKQSLYQTIRMNFKFIIQEQTLSKEIYVRCNSNQVFKNIIWYINWNKTVMVNKNLKNR